jgi:ABC-type antimicrobial peptide transport system permease subunit
VAGIGPTFVGASIISPAGLTAFDIQAPLAVNVFPHTPADREAILPALQAIAGHYPDVWLFDIRRIADLQYKTMESIRSLMSSMLLLAVVSAGLGVVNTSVISLAERRREFAVLRAAGALRGQVRSIVLVEGLLFGLTGAFVGTLAGAGLVILYVVCTGGSAFGFPDFPTWETAFASVGPALERGLIALLVSPLLTAVASILPLRRTLRGTVVESLGSRGD